MKRRSPWIWAVMIALGVSGMSAVSPLPVLAASDEKVISSVTIRVESDLEPGDTLPDIGYSNESDSSETESGTIVITNSSSKYYISDAKWVTSTSKTMEVGDEPVMKVWLTPATVGDTEYYFKGTYRSSNVNIKKGDFVSATKSGDDLVVKLRVDAIEGDFPAPEDAYWKENSKGTARWEEPEEGGTDYYEVVLRRGSTKVYTVKTSSRSYNFYPYMTTAGTYTFRVRTIAKTSKEEDYGKNSEWVESDEIYLAKEDVSDGSGQNNDYSSSTGGSSTSSSPSGNTNVGWRQSNGHWYYYYPDGSYQRNSWMQLNGKWYLFDSTGQMMTGWQVKNNQTYYLSDSGDMVTGWIRSGQTWYYLNPTKDNYEGCMLRNRWLTVDGKTYYLNVSGAMLEGWNQVDGSWYYFYPGSGHKAVNTYIDTFYVNQDGVWVR